MQNDLYVLGLLAALVIAASIPQSAGGALWLASLLLVAVWARVYAMKGTP